jgi:hypothetical protein
MLKRNASWQSPWNEETQNRYTNRDAMEERRREREETKRSQNIIVTTVHKWALDQGFLGRNRKEVNTN